MNLKNKLIKLGSKHPELRKHIRPVLDKTAGYGDSSTDNFMFDGREYGTRQNAIEEAMLDWLESRNWGQVRSVREGDLSSMVKHVNYHVMDSPEFPRDRLEGGAEALTEREAMNILENKGVPVE